MKSFEDHLNNLIKTFPEIDFSITSGNRHVSHIIYAMVKFEKSLYSEDSKDYDASGFIVGIERKERETNEDLIIRINKRYKELGITMLL